MPNEIDSGYSPSFYNENWTVLQKIVYLTKWCKENTVDINSITLSSSTPDAQGAFTITVTGKNYKGETVTLGTIPGKNGTNGDPGADGRSITQIFTLSHSVVGNETVTTVQVSYNEGTPDTFEIHTANGADGSEITGIISGTSYTSGDFTITPITIYIDGVAQQPINIYAKNGVNTGGAQHITISNVATSGSLSNEEYNILMQDKTQNYIVWNDKIYTPCYLVTPLGKYYYKCIGMKLESVSGLAINNLFMETMIISAPSGTTSATYTVQKHDPFINKIELDNPSTATNGTLTQQQFGMLLANPYTAQIIFAGEIYYPQDIQDDAGYRVYTHHGETSSKVETTKMIYLTLSTMSWVLTITEKDKLYMHHLQINSNSGTAYVNIISKISVSQTDINFIKENYKYLAVGYVQGHTLSIVYKSALSLELIGMDKDGSEFTFTNYTINDMVEELT